MVLAVIVAAGFIVDTVAVHRTESTISSNIEHRFPGSRARVTISSSPFLVRLALSGTVDDIRVHVTGVEEGALDIAAVDVDVHGLRLSRSSLIHGQVRPTGMSRATVTVTLSLAAVLQFIGSAISGIGIPSGSGSIAIDPSGATITFGPVSFRFRYTSLIPCVGSARLSGTDVILSCTTRSLPPALKDP